MTTSRFNTVTRLATATALLTWAAFVATPAWAHAHLKATVPAQNASVTASPTSLELAFTENLEAAFSGLELSDQAGKPIKTGKATLASDNAAKLVVPVETPLPSGQYQVKWHVLSVDGHKTQGDYRFTVK